MAKNYLGIDLGTTESTVSCIFIESRRDEPMEKLKALNIYQFNKSYRYDRDLLGLQSSIFIDRDKGGVYTGEYAKYLYSQGDRPLQTIRSIKTRIGTESLIQIPSSSNPADVLNCDMTELSALLLKTIKLSVENQISSQDIINTTITIPAAFNSDERNATLDAARLAGFENVNILDEPTAVLLSYLNDDDLGGELDFTEAKKILVYDIGGGTLDISIAEVEDDEGDYTVKILGRSPRMDFGGDDIDKYIASYFLYEFEKINPSIEERSEEDQARIVSRIVSQAENAKIEFNKKISSYLDNERRRKKIKQSVNFEVVDGLSITDLSLTDETLKDILFDVIGKEGKLSIPIKKVLLQSLLDKSDIDLVVLTGGSGKFYLVHETLNKFFDENVEILEYTETSAVSKGAAIHSYNYTEDKLKKINLDDLMSDDIFIKRESRFDKLIPAHTEAGSEGFYEYKFEKVSNRLEVFLYHGIEKEAPCKYKEITGVFKTLNKSYGEGDTISISWKFDENKILHLYYEDTLLVNTQDKLNKSSDLVEYYELNENKV